MAIPLRKGLEPPTVRAPRYIQIDANVPDTVDLYGLWMRNDGHTSIDTKSLVFCLDFSEQVTQASRGGSCWSPAPSDQASYKTEFRCNAGQATLAARERWEFPWLNLTPIPSETMRVKARVFYGGTAEASFTLQRANGGR